MFLKPDQVELGPAKDKAAFSESRIPYSGRTGWGILGVERRQREWGLIGKPGTQGNKEQADSGEPTT